jgi:hypothetical protein
MFMAGRIALEVPQFNRFITFCPIQFLFVLIGIRATGRFGFGHLLGNVAQNDKTRKATFPDPGKVLPPHGKRHLTADRQRAAAGRGGHAEGGYR